MSSSTLLTSKASSLLCTPQHNQVTYLTPPALTSLVARHLAVLAKEAFSELYGSNPHSDTSIVMPTSLISIIITSDCDISKYLETIYNILLCTQAHKHGAMLRETDYITTRAISYPHWERDHAVPTWITNPKLTKIREEYPSDLPKLQSGALIYLCNEDLVEHSHGFELHSACGRQGKMSWHKFGYHVCKFELHLYTITAH